MKIRKIQPEMAQNWIESGRDRKIEVCEAFCLKRTLDIVVYTVLLFVLLMLKVLLC
jgi:hypothetical protein